VPTNCSPHRRWLISGTAADGPVAELRREAFLPADEATASVLTKLGRRHRGGPELRSRPRSSSSTAALQQRVGSQRAPRPRTPETRWSSLHVRRTQHHGHPHSKRGSSTPEFRSRRAYAISQRVDLRECRRPRMPTSQRSVPVQLAGLRRSLVMSGSSEGDPEGDERPFGVAGVVAEGGGEVDRPGAAERPDREVTQGRHDLRGGAGADLGGVL
jgi:hypothetical protein